MLPRRVALEFQRNKSAEAERMENVTMYCSDIVDFTDIANKSSPMEVIKSEIRKPWCNYKVAVAENWNGFFLTLKKCIFCLIFADKLAKDMLF